MTIPVQPPSFQNPPQQYSALYVQSLLREIRTLVERLNAVGALRGSTLNLTEVPTGAYGLAQGDVYVDANGFLRWVAKNDIIPKTVAGMTASLGTVTTTP